MPATPKTSRLTQRIVAGLKTPAATVSTARTDPTAPPRARVAAEDGHRHRDHDVRHRLRAFGPRRRLGALGGDRGLVGVAGCRAAIADRVLGSVRLPAGLADPSIR